MPAATADRPRTYKTSPKPRPKRRGRPPARPKLFTTDEVAAMTGRAAVTVKLRSLRFQEMGEQFGIKVGRQWLYNEDEVRDLAAIPNRRGRAEPAVIEARRMALDTVPLEDLARVSAELSAEPEDYGLPSKGSDA
jgi:hypothetical protein